MERTEHSGNQEKPNRWNCQSPMSCNVTSALPLCYAPSAAACKTRFVPHTPNQPFFHTRNLSDSLNKPRSPAFPISVKSLHQPAQDSWTSSCQVLALGSQRNRVLSEICVSHQSPTLNSQITSFHSLDFFGIMSTTCLCAVPSPVPVFTWTSRCSLVKTGAARLPSLLSQGTLQRHFLSRKTAILVPNRE